MPVPFIVWFRRDLRLSDNPALQHAIQSKCPVIPIYIWSPEEEGDWSPGSASRYWLHESLNQLRQKLERLNSRLIIRAGDPCEVLDDIVGSTKSQGILWNRLYEPFAIQRDSKLKTYFREQGLLVQTFNASLLNEPMNILSKQGTPYKVFTPYWKLCRTLEPPAPLAGETKEVLSPDTWPRTQSIDSLKLKPKIPWFNSIKKHWQMGENAAEEKLTLFLQDGLSEYPKARDYPASSGVSSLSPHLHFGEISPRQVWHKVINNEQELGYLTPRESTIAFLRQLYWREFAHYLLFHFPETPNEPLYEKYKKFSWLSGDEKLRAWQKGVTGYPIVDAGMRELWHTGSMHNRVRMIVGSFLVKDLLIHWGEGARWFWDTLVDANLANNTLGWQWIAGCGADAAPFFRIFNPVTQGEKYDANGDYVRKWVPELASLSNKFIHKPWQADKAELKKCGIELGVDYPLPIIDHADARKRALSALAELKEKS